jgi:glycosyltransferase involved in cell wall biosynthesis
MPKLSIVIPTYNEEKYLPLLLRSIKAQTFTDYEVIVADNDSTDRTPEIVRDFGVKLVRGGPHPSIGRNNGAKEAMADLLLFLDADVILPDPWFLQMTVAEFEKRHLDVATCKIEPMSSKPIDKIYYATFNYYMWVTQATAPHAQGCCIFVRRRLHAALNGFDEAIKLAEDHDYVERAAKIGKFAVLESYKIPVSVRRFDRDGRLNIAIKYLIAELHLRTKGSIKSDKFNYTWGYDDSAEPKPKRRGVLSRLRRR